MGNSTQAESLFQRALAIREQHQGSQHPDTAESLHDFAAFQSAQGNNEEAVSLYQRAFTIRKQALGAHHPKMMETRECYAALLRTMGRQDEAVLLEASQPEQAQMGENQKTRPEKRNE